MLMRYRNGPADARATISQSSGALTRFSAMTWYITSSAVEAKTTAASFAPIRRSMIVNGASSRWNSRW